LRDRVPKETLLQSRVYHIRRRSAEC
jgi:hypothetical protein